MRNRGEAGTEEVVTAGSGRAAEVFVFLLEDRVVVIEHGNGIEGKGNRVPDVTLQQYALLIIYTRSGFNTISSKDTVPVSRHISPPSVSYISPHH